MMSDAGEDPDIHLGRFATESITLALYLMGALTAIGAYQEFTRSLNPIVLVLLFCILSMSPPLLMIWCVYRYRWSHGGVAFNQSKNIVPIVSGIVFLLISLCLLLAPTYFDAFNRAALLGRIYVEEHKAIIEADGAAMAIDTNRELGALDTAGAARFIDTQTALRDLSFGLIARADGAVLAHSAGRTMIPNYKVQQHIGEAKRAGGSAAFVDTNDNAVVSVVELDTPVGDYLVVGSLINEVAVADWTRVQNYIGGPTQSSGIWMSFAALGLLAAAIGGSWWAATRLSRRGRAQHNPGRGGDRQQ